MSEVELSLPATIASRRDVVKLQREIESLLEERLQHDIAKQQTGDLRKVAATARIISQFFDHNKLEVTDQNLKTVMQQLESIRLKAPIIRIAFANEPDIDVAEKVVGWFRKEIDPLVLVQIGVQPMIAGGAVVQTPMRRYDFSLRKQLLNSQDKFLEVMKRVG